MMADYAPPSLFSNPEALMKLGCALMAAGQGAKAVELVRSALAHGDDPALRAAARVILSHRIPQWHAPMLADVARNEAFDRAIARAIPGKGSVLDIGAGTGLLSLMAARAGAPAVFACEANAALAATATEIVAQNGYADTIGVLASSSRDLDREKVDGGVDLIVAEIFSDDLLAEGVLATIENASASLANEGCQVIPCAGSIRIALAWYDYDRLGIGEAAGFDLSLFERHMKQDRKLKVDDPQLSLRSEPATLFDFDFQSGGPFPPERTSTTLTCRGGTANGIVRWIRLQLDAETRFENEPGAGTPSHWSALFTPLPGKGLEDGESVAVHAAHDRDQVMLWVD